MSNLFGLANANFREGDIGSSIEKYQSLINSCPDFYLYYLNLGLAYKKLEQYENAERFIRKAYCISPESQYLLGELKSCTIGENAGGRVRLSVIVPVHNTGRFLRKCIESILGQSYKNLELIVINDGSSDDSVEIIKDYEKIDPRLVFINNARGSGNPGTPRNMALSIARGDYVGFVDSDDWIDQDFYLELMTVAETKKTDIVFSGGFKNFIGEDFTIRKYGAGSFDNKKSSFYRYHESFMIWDKVFKRSLIDKFCIRLGETKAAVDVPFIFRIYYYAKSVWFCDDLIGYNYRRETATSVTVNFRKKSNCFFEFEAYKGIWDWVKNEKVSDNFKKVIDVKKVTSYIYTLGLINKNDFSDFFERVKAEFSKIKRETIEEFSKEMKKGWVLKKYDRINSSTAEDYFSEIRPADGVLYNTKKFPAKLVIEGGKSGIVFFPAWVKSNPYQEMFYGALNRKYDVRVVGYDKDKLSLDLLRALKGEFSYLHLHWLHSFINEENFQLASFLELLENAKALGYKIIYTAHNIVSHESNNLAQELEIRRRLVSLFDIAIAHGVLAKRRLIDELHVEESKIKVVPHGVYTGYYKNHVSVSEAREYFGIPDNKFVFLFFGNIREYKGVIPLLDAFKKLSKSAPDAVLLIAGRVSDIKTLDLINSEVSGFDNIYFRPGFVDDDQVQYYLNACDVFVLPYNKILTSGAALLALSFNKPIVAPRDGVLPEFVTSELGALFESYDEMLGVMIDFYEKWSSGHWSEKFHEIDFRVFSERYCWDNLLGELEF